MKIDENISMDKSIRLLRAQLLSNKEKIENLEYHLVRSNEKLSEEERNKVLADIVNLKEAITSHQRAIECLTKGQENVQKDIKAEIEDVFKQGYFEEYQVITTFKENHLHWLSFITNSIEKRRIAETLFLKGYSIKEVDDVLVLADGEASLVKQHLDRYGTINMDSIVNTLMEIYRKQTTEAVIERMMKKDFSYNDILDVIRQISK